LVARVTYMVNEETHTAAMFYELDVKYESLVKTRSLAVAGSNKEHHLAKDKRHQFLN
jgi:hypothetical protein